MDCSCASLLARNEESVHILYLSVSTPCHLSILCGMMYSFFPRHIDYDDTSLSHSDKPELSDHTSRMAH